MFDRIRTLGSDTAVYGVSTILGRFLTFLLTPLYTHALAPGDMGIVATLFAYIAILNVLYWYGMESAYMKYVSTLELGTKQQVFSVPFLSLLATSAVFSALLIAGAGPVARLIDLPGGSTHLVVYGAVILFLDALTIIPFAALRMERKAKLFAGVKLASIVLNVVLNVVLLFRFQMGIEGIFVSNVISSAFTLMILTPAIVESFVPGWHRGLFRALLRFGLPYVPAGLAAILIQVINRPIMEALSGRAAVGIFQANYRLGIFMMLVVSMFDFAWRPFFLSHASDSDARPLFARVLTYFVLAATGIFLALAFFVEPVVQAPIFGGKPMIAEPYWSGLPIVPVILLAYLFLGVYNNLIAGVYIEKRTAVLPVITITGAAVNILANYLLIPPFGLMGAAFATLAAYAVMAGAMYATGRRIYPVPYEWGRIAKIAGAAAIVYLASTALPSGVAGIAGKFLLLAAFVGLMVMMRFFSPAEMSGLAGLVKRTGPPREPDSVA